MALTEFNDIDLMIRFASGSYDPGAWYPLRYQDLGEDQLDDLSLLFYNDNIPKSAACNVFYHQGDDRTLEMLLADIDNLKEIHECSRAAGGILSAVNVPQSSIGRIIDLIVETDDDLTAQNLLYGFWRSPINRPAPGSANSQKLLQKFIDRSDREPVYTDEYLVRLTGAAGAELALNRVLEREGGVNLQFEVETARAIRVLPPELVQSKVVSLLNRPNPHVGVMVLESLQQISGLDGEWLIELADLLNHFPNHPETTLSYLELLIKNDRSIENYLDLLNKIDSENPYLKNRVLAIYRSKMDQPEFIELLRSNLKSEGIAALHATGSLTSWIRDGVITSEKREFTREVLTNALEQQNRSIISVSEPILSNPQLFNREDEPLIRESLQRALDGNDRSVAQVLLSALESMGLSGSDTDIELPVKPFRKPDWARLSELGESPHWVLDTNRGRIVIQLDPLGAPFTVSSIDHLTAKGVYNGVVFHRVVRNFVIQGGDFDRKDGFGGPDYRMPTEPSYSTFRRGSVGMASSGPDTEGSQFFITHTRTPHLDGLYTIFGEVIEGMDVVDRIEMGDVVLKAEILIN